MWNILNVHFYIGFSHCTKKYLKKWHGEWTDRQTDRRTDGHCQSMTDLAKRAESVKTQT